MFFKIDPHNGVPIYDQVVRQIVYAVADEMLKPGELVPSVRELAKQLAINPNTVTRAYRELQSHLILETVRGTGLQVADKATRICQRKRHELIRLRLQDVLREAIQSGLEDGDLESMFSDELKKSKRQVAAERKEMQT